MSTLADELETTTDIAFNVAGQGMKRVVSELSFVSFRSQNLPTVGQVSCPSYDAIQQESVMYVQAPSAF